MTSRSILFALLAVAAFSPPVPGANDTDPVIQHVVIEPATKDTPRSDTASIARLTNERIMVVYHKYESGDRSGHDHGLCRIWSKVSDDDGKTWRNLACWWT